MKPLFWKGGKNVYCIISCVLWYHVQFESNFVASLVSFVAVLSPVTCLHLPWWDLTVMQIIIPCVATKLKACYLLQILFLSLLTLACKKRFCYTHQLLLHCTCIRHFLFYGRTFLQSNWENREHQKNFWNVIVLQDKSQLGVTN